MSVKQKFTKISKTELSFKPFIREKCITVLCTVNDNGKNITSWKDFKDKMS